ncbi:hypothetical protein L7F22_026557 [Adiantum nelumboides]|nr:hypothetical protein [Adiantum nelumboides]
MYSYWRLIVALLFVLGELLLLLKPFMPLKGSALASQKSITKNARVCTMCYRQRGRGGSLPPDLHAFLDSDWAGCFDTRVSTSGFCFMLGSSCISWLSKKQPAVATSSCEAEYKAVFTATVECVWLRRLMDDLGVEQDTANTIYTDNQSALAVARNPVFHARTKHIEVHYHYVRERLSAGEISMAYVPTQDNLADLFTKALSREKLEAFRKGLGLLPFVD